MPTTPVAIGLGSNLGGRRDRLEAGVEALGSLLNDLRCSRVYHSQPMYLRRQPPFLNACCVGETRLSARDLLAALQRIERRAGRREGGVRFGPRELDLDLLLYGSDMIDETDLRVPHPRMSERPFVLLPLTEVAGDWLHPATGSPIREMAARVPRKGLRPYVPPAASVDASASPLPAPGPASGEGS